jgi:Uma2 family endonuclease
MSALATVKPKRWTREEFHRLAASGVLPPDERYELVKGEIIPLSARGARHLSAQYGLAERLTEMLRGQGILVRTEYPVAIAEDGEPVVDILVLQGPASRYTGRLPTGGDVLLAIEVSYSTLEYDREDKRALYASEGIPVYWVLNLKDDQLHVFTNPNLLGYVDETTLRPGDHVEAPRGAPRLPVAELFPPRTSGGAEEAV